MLDENVVAAPAYRMVGHLWNELGDLVCQRCWWPTNPMTGCRECGTGSDKPRMTAAEIKGMVCFRGSVPADLIQYYVEAFRKNGLLLPWSIRINTRDGGVCVSTTHNNHRSVAEADEIEPGVWWVCRVLVHKSQRGAGLGRALVQRMVIACLRRGAKEIRVCPGGYDLKESEQRAFYASCGFKPQDPDHPSSPMVLVAP